MAINFHSQLLTASSKKIMQAIAQAKKAGACVVVDANVAEIYQIAADYELPPGEAAKRWDVLSALLEVLAAKKHERSQELWVVGGGAACDLGALAASLYRRGCPLVLVPTTFLAGVDASVGGKTAIDQISRGRLIKNFAGTFYPAKKVWLSSDWWQSLPAEEVRSGLGECLKIYWLEGKTVPRKILQQIAQNKPLGKKGNQLLLSAVKAKLKYVKKDPYDNKGIREALNYGHTVGHALESLAKGRLTHGEAIAWGMWAETQWLGSDFSTEIYLVLEQLGFKFPHFLKKIKSDQWEVFLQQDKKVEQGKISCSILLKPKQQKKVRIDPKVLAKFCATLFAMAARRL